MVCLSAPDDGPTPTLTTNRIPPLAGLVAVGYGVATYREAQIEKHLARSAAAEQTELEQRRKNQALADAYGDRTNLEELERAMRVYEAQQGNE